MTTSPLSRLPTELRLLIYSFVFSQPSPITLALTPKNKNKILLALPKDLYRPSRTVTQASESPFILDFQQPTQNFLALTRTSRHIRRENLPIVLESNDWRICNTIPLHDTHPDRIGEVVDGVKSWLTSVGPSWRTSLRSVEFDTAKCWLGAVENNVDRIVEVMKRVKELFADGKVLKLKMSVRISWNVYQPIHGDVGPFELCFDGRSMEEMVNVLRKEADVKEEGLRGKNSFARRREQMRDCEEKIRGMLAMLDVDPEWYW